MSLSHASTCVLLPAGGKKGKDAELPVTPEHASLPLEWDLAVPNIFNAFAALEAAATTTPGDAARTLRLQQHAGVLRKQAEAQLETAQLPTSRRDMVEVATRVLVLVSMEWALSAIARDAPYPKSCDK